MLHSNAEKILVSLSGGTQRKSGQNNTPNIDWCPLGADLASRTGPFLLLYVDRKWRGFTSRVVGCVRVGGGQRGVFATTPLSSKGACACVLTVERYVLTATNVWRAALFGKLPVLRASDWSRWADG